ncbi:hypothetical protein PHYPO_G00147250 [Pangasianodon hypophthalmus]|uniref:Peptidase M12A domain-containing protein n=1 Tax=Pangasianodon hypophthalmus TaxID=310915 RepID=A0A5N5K3L1_PANHP|nr:hypothetical protein PHYPO_G00147250 [Pangasianodon hypophthalmus]
MSLIQNIILLLLSISLVQSRSIKALFNETSEETDNSIDRDYFSVSAIIERANKNVGKLKGEFAIVHGDIAVYTGLQNADPCTSRGCKWRKGRNGKVKVPFIISSQYSRSERRVIQRGLKSFENSTCIRFKPRTNEEDYIHIISDTGFAFSKNREPTIIPIPDNNVPIGRATEMSPNDILRVNRLYCS